MNYWLLPSNNNFFRLDDLLEKREVISWRQVQKFEVGDVIYIYSSKPFSCIKYQMDVVGANLSFSRYIDDEEYWVDKDYYHTVAVNRKNYAEFKLVRRIPQCEALSHLQLKAHGLKTVQIAQRLNGELLDYILDVVNKHSVPADIDTESIPEAAGGVGLTEGATIQVTLNRYERSRIARNKCIETKGCRCAICGMDFEERYGTIGHGFIHIHHTTPISSIGKDYQIDYEKDLVPVCPNCHAMLHRKNPPYTIDELKELIALSNK